MFCSRRLSFIASVGFAALLYGGAPAWAAIAPTLGNAQSFAVLAGSQVTNTGSTTITGNVGIYPGIGSPPHYTGFGSVTLIGGAVHDADALAQSAQFDAAAAYTWIDLNNGCDFTYPGAVGELAGQTLAPGTYCATSFHITSGALTLVGNASDVWVFKSASDLVITGGSVVSPSCDVWWRVLSTASFDAGSSLKGNILALTSVTLAANASLSGRAFAQTAAVTLSSNTVSPCLPAAGTPTPTPNPNATATPTPTPRGGAPIPALSGSASVVFVAVLTLLGFVAIRRIST